MTRMPATRTSLITTPEGLLTFGMDGDVTTWTRAGERERSFGGHPEPSWELLFTAIDS